LRRGVIRFGDQVIDIISKRVSDKFMPETIASYIVFRDGDTFYAKDGRTGQIVYSSTDSEALLQYVLNIANDGDVIYIKDVVYADTLVSRKRVVLTGSGAIYTKTGKLVRLLGNIAVKDLEVDFYTPRAVKQMFVEQFTDPNLSAWLKDVPSGGSVQVYQETKKVDIFSFVERGVILTGGGLYKAFPLTYRKMRIIIQVVDLAIPSADKAFFDLATPASPYSPKFILKIDTSGNLKIVYVNTAGSPSTITTNIKIDSRPVVITLDVDDKMNYVRIYVDNNVITITDFAKYSNLMYIVLVAEADYTTKYNLVYVEYLDDVTQTPVSTVGRPDSFHPVGVSDSLGVYALGLVYPDNSTYVEIRDLKTDALVKIIDLDETVSYSDEHEYVHTRFAVEGSKRYLYVLLSRHINNYTIYKIDADSWSVVWKKSGNVATYCKLIWGWVTGLAVLYRDNNGNMAIDHIDPSTGSIVRTDVIVSSGGYTVYGYFTPDWSGDGYLWLAWSVYDSSSGLRRNVYALAIDRNGNVYAPDGSRITLPASSTDNRLLIETSDYSLPFIRPAREGAVVFKTGSYTPDKPSAWWLKKPGQIISLELPSMPYIGAPPTLIGRVPATISLTYVLRMIDTTRYVAIAYTPLLPVSIAQQYSNIILMPAKDSRLFVPIGNILYIYRTGYPAQYDGEIII